MTDRMERALRRLHARLPGSVFRPGDDGYQSTVAIWPKPSGTMPQAVVHCRTTDAVRAAIEAARESDAPLSVRAGGHDWAGRALCPGIVIDLSGMNHVDVHFEDATARIMGGACISDVVAASDPLGLAAATGMCAAVGMAGLTLGGGYGPLIGRFGLALDNLLAAEVVLADGRVVITKEDSEPELFWALRGGGGNFGVVTAMHHRLHRLPIVRSGLLAYPFSEARAVLEHCADMAAAAPDELTVQLALVGAPDGSFMLLVIPLWCGAPEEGETQTAAFEDLGRSVQGTVDVMTYGKSLAPFDSFVVNGQRTFMDTCSLPEITSESIDIFLEAMATSVSPGCAILTHEFKGAASRVPREATAFGIRRDHVLIEILAAFQDRGDELEAQRHREWVQSTKQAFDAVALPGGYPTFFATDDVERAEKAFGANAARLGKAKRRYDPDNIFNSAIPIPF